MDCLTRENKQHLKSHGWQEAELGLQPAGEWRLPSSHGPILNTASLWERRGAGLGLYGTYGPHLGKALLGRSIHFSSKKPKPNGTVQNNTKMYFKNPLPSCLRYTEFAENDPFTWVL